MMDCSSVLAVGDPRRAPIGRAVVGTLIAATTFVMFTYVTKEVRSLYIRSPWEDDPYDSAITFSLFFVPIVVALTVLRVPLCRRAEPLPVQRALALLRSSRLALGIVSLTLLSDWISVVLRTHHEQWTGTTAVLVAVLSVVSAAAIKVAIDVCNASLHHVYSPALGADAPDWFGDILLATDLRWIHRHILGAIRRHPITVAAMIAAGFGVAVAAGVGFTEGTGPGLLIDVVVGGCGMFAFLIVAGAYIGLVRRERPLSPAKRRLIDATVAACAGVQIALAFRESLWWVVGASGAGAGPTRLLGLLLVCALPVFAATLAAETVAHAHQRRQTATRI